ncbi:protein-L-isoaspartate O-methyltransferase [Streptomyces sp. NPDC050504]|uniref:protein-L-isoaspartate O-methyltransferase n=1 Tax=Streptomyces sp. NPDC050504 TaxID=3365618 RepID=UPI00378E9667
MDAAAHSAKSRRSGRWQLSRGTGMDRRAVCLGELETMGVFRAPWVRDAIDAVDRTMFAPRRLWSLETDDQGLHRLLDRKESPAAWLEAVWNAHQSVIVQMDDGRTRPDGAARGDFTSSLSALDIVCEKLVQLDVRPGQRVLEIGAASGYHTALLAHRAGDSRVTGVEVDPELAAWGQENLKRAGCAARLECGDGLEGWAAEAPYDRIVSTASVRKVPAAWRRQSADGAVVLTPFNTLYCRGGLLRLTVKDRVATGRFSGTADYMWARGQRPPDGIRPPGTYRCRPSAIDPGQVLDRGWAQDFALGLHVPDVHVTHRVQDGARQTQLWDAAGTSVTVIRHHHWWHKDAVTVWGKRDLWHELTTAYTAWRTAGQPHPTRYGLTIDDHGQHLWLDTPPGQLHNPGPSLEQPSGRQEHRKEESGPR